MGGALSERLVQTVGYFLETGGRKLFVVRADYVDFDAPFAHGEALDF